MKKLVLFVVLAISIFLISIPAYAETQAGNGSSEEGVVLEEFLKKYLLKEDLNQISFEETKSYQEQIAQEITEIRHQQEQVAKEKATRERLLKGGSPSANRELGKYLVWELYGWGGDQFSCLDKLIMSESSWKHTAQNPRSTAYGIFQFLNGTWSSTGYSKSSKPEIQIRAGLKYIKNRYNSPCRAWSFKLATIKRDSSYAPSDLQAVARVWISKGYTGY